LRVMPDDHASERPRCERSCGPFEHLTDAEIKCKKCRSVWRWDRAAPRAEPNPKLYDAAHISSAVHGILSPEKILEMSRSGHIPHVATIDGGIWFRKPDTVAFIRRHYTTDIDAVPLPRVLPVAILTTSETLDALPGPLEPLRKHLRQYTPSFMLPCVYFLVRGGNVVYVGQTVSIEARMAAHRASKEFDNAFYLNVPESILLEVETAFIKSLRPELNVSIDGRLVCGSQEDDVTRLVVDAVVRGDAPGLAQVAREHEDDIAKAIRALPMRRERPRSRIKFCREAFSSYSRTTAARRASGPASDASGCGAGIA
jgi:hypothetical protein